MWAKIPHYLKNSTHLIRFPPRVNSLEQSLNLYFLVCILNFVKERKTLLILAQSVDDLDQNVFNNFVIGNGACVFKLLYYVCVQSIIS